MSNDAQIYEDAFTITQVQDQTYERVARVSGTTDSNDTLLTLDINNELFPLDVGQPVRMVIATTLNEDGQKEQAGWRAKSADEGLAQYYEYVCYGKVYKHHDPGDGANM